MKKILLTFLGVLAFACSSDDAVATPPVEENPNPENPDPTGCDNIFVGYPELKSQADVDAFAAHNYCAIDGSLFIGDFETGSNDITDLSGLASIIEISGQLSISYNDQLTNLHGLENLKSVGGLIIYSNSQLNTIEHLLSLSEASNYGQHESFINISFNLNLTSLKGLEKLENVEKISIYANGNLTDLTGLNSLKKVGFMSIMAEDLISLDGLDNIDHIDHLELNGNSSLASVVSLSNLHVLGDFWCGGNNITTLPTMSNLTELKSLSIYNSKITSLDGLNSVTKVIDVDLSSNSQLTSLHGLENLTTFAGLRINGCPNVTSLNALSSVTAVIDHAETFTDKYEGIQVAGTNISSLDGFENIISFNGDLKFDYNLHLTDFCAVSNFIANAETVLIEDNGFNPELQDFVNGNCSQ